MSISKIFYQTLSVFSQIKDRKHIEHNFNSVARVMPRVGLVGAGRVKNFSEGICDGAPSTARSSIQIQKLQNYFILDISYQRSWRPSFRAIFPHFVCPLLHYIS